MKQNKGLYGVVLILIVILTATVVFFAACDRFGTGEPDATASVTEQPTPEPTPEVLTYKEITLLSAGDIMYHMPQVRAAATGNGYDFTGNMQYVKPFVEAADYAVVNLETTLAGTENGYSYSGFPTFNSPDSTVDSIRYAGFDMLLLANNHCYDTGTWGLKRTLQIVSEKGLAHLGTRADTNGKTYQVVNINGVQVGLLNYTYEIGSDGKVGINGITVADADIPLIDTFNENNLDAFYEAVRTRMAELKSEGADLIVFYIHWGEEYSLVPSETQKAIAQKLCDMGVDALIGGHPHVIQPMETLTSTDQSHTMPCFYSLGNYISNQNRETLPKPNVLYTENGVMPILTIRKYSNGVTCISKIEYIATWVHRHGSYEIVPIEAALQAPDAYGLTSSSFGVSHCTAAKQMTDDLLKAGVDAFNAAFTPPFSNAEAE